MAIKNPFAPAEKVAKKLKVLIYGASGSGKTRAALTFPRPAVIDTENGTDLYAGRTGVPAFSVLRAKTLSDVEAAVAFIREDGGKTFETLIVDAITVLYDVQKDAASKTGKNEEMDPRLWNRVNRRMVSLYNSLTNLPVHVVVIARESELYEGEGLNLRKTGTKPDADKKIAYMFDFVVRMKMDHSGEIIKSRGVNISNAMTTVNWNAFEKAAGLFTDGQQVAVLSDEKAAETDARAYADTPQPTTSAPAKSPASAPAETKNTPDTGVDWPNNLRLIGWAWDTFRIPKEGLPAAIAKTKKAATALTKDEAKGAVLAAYCAYDSEKVATVAAEKELSIDVVTFANTLSL